MVHTTLINAFEDSYTRLPQLSREVGIAIHARRILNRVAAYQVPDILMHHVWWPCSAFPIVVWQVLIFVPSERVIFELRSSDIASQ